MKTLAIIPARGGSKGVKNKNIRNVAGKPLLFYAVDAAKESKLLTDYLVATDSDDIIEVTKKYTQNIFKRSAVTAQDNSPIEQVIEEVLKTTTTQYDIIILLQPTAPIRTGEDIDKVITMFIEDNNLDNVVSVIELEDIHPARMYNLGARLEMTPLEKSKERARRQDLSPVYLRNGCIYAIKTEAFKQTKKLMTDNKKAYVMPESLWANVDTERDLLLVEVLIKEWKLGKL
ncbi:acylneuraminate cytidylyltransferase family protein [Pseudofulvibacter geojedonensis]|uniref:Cytidylyltransferase domain-containing protein n=1 Tax=Pseudofulvibacter geojedonensis TaxID=1123758 RepID=A0ABW3HYK2_9FLAO